MPDLSGLPPVVTRRMMGPWSLTREHLRGATRESVLRLARALGFASPEGWDDRRLLRRVYRVVRQGRKRVVREHHLALSSRGDLERLARFVGLRPRASWGRDKLERRVWELVDSRSVASPGAV